MEKPSNLLAHIHVIRLLRKLLKVLLGLSLLVGLAVGAAFAVFNGWFLPRLDQFRPQLEQTLSQATGRQVRIAVLSGNWQGLAPRLQLQGVHIANPQNGAALTLDRVAIQPSWWSLLAWEPLFSSVILDGPRVELLRTAEGRILLNGFDLTAPAASAASKNAEAQVSANWLLRQNLIQIRNANIGWQDLALGLPRLELQQGQLTLSRGLFGHRLALSGQPAATLGKGFDLELSWRGDDFRHWMDWSGSAHIGLNGAKAGMLSRYMARIGLVSSGEGSGRLDADFSDGHINSLTADVSIHNAAYTPKDAQTLVLPVISGKLQLERSARGNYQINASDLTLASATGLAFDNSSIRGDWTPGLAGQGRLTLDNVNVAHITPFIHALGGDGNVLLSSFAPSGRLKDLSISWQGPLESPRQYTVDSRFEQLAWQPFGSIPGVGGVSGGLHLGQQGGQLLLASDHAVLNYPLVFPEQLHFDKLNAAVGWQSQGSHLQIDFKDVAFANADLKGRFGGQYRRDGSGSGFADFTANVDSVAAIRVPAYLPHAVGADTLKWLKQALQGGTARNVSMVLKGDLNQFPFVAGKGGEFRVDAKVDNGSLLYEKGWPLIDRIQADLGFHNEKMLISSQSARTLGVPLSQVAVGIDNLAAHEPVLSVKGRAQDTLARMLKFTTSSPVDGWLDGFTGNIHAEGNAALDLQLGIPLAGKAPVKVRGDILLAGNQLQFKGLPVPLASNAHGHLVFTEHGVESSGVQFSALGGQFLLKAASTPAGQMNFDIQGEADSARALDAYLPLLSPYVSGRSPFSIHFAIQKGLESLSVQSSLVGTTIEAPAPIGKLAQTAQPLQLTLDPGKGNAQTLKLDIALGELGRAALLLSEHGDLRSGIVAVGRPLGNQPSEGLALRLAAPQLDLQAWIAAINGPSGLHAGTQGLASAPLFPLVIELDSPQLDGWGNSLHKVTARLSNHHLHNVWSLDIHAHELSGNIDYLPEGNGLLRANLAYALLNPSGRGDSTAAGQDGELLDKGDWPALDVRVGDLIYQGKVLGRLDMHARRDGSDWLLEPLRLSVAEGSLNGSIRVRRGPAGKEVETHYKLESSDVGKLLGRVGLQDTFRKGEGSLSGTLSWPGGVFDLNASRLSGTMTVDLKNGRFAKVDPGVARLLGILSLQSLSRRIKLDFTDVFSDGFAFDAINGDAKVSRGVFVSDNVHMKGPAADVFIKGEVNLASEMQDVHIRVQPHLAESVALAAGAALLNPVVGVAALAAQKVLQDPVGKILSVDYVISGSFANPKVEKVAPDVLNNSIRTKP